MFIRKKNYYLFLDNTKLFNFNLIKKNYKTTIIYRYLSNQTKERITQLIRFRKKCRTNKIRFFIANDLNLVRKTKADGIYISAYNKKNYKFIKKIGSAHNYKEVSMKIKQNCQTIIFSRLFTTNYINKKNYYGIIKFNLIAKNVLKQIFPLGGIRNSNLLKLNMIQSEGFALLSEIKKKPAVLSRLF